MTIGSGPGPGPEFNSLANLLDPVAKKLNQITATVVVYNHQNRQHRQALIRNLNQLIELIAQVSDNEEENRRRFSQRYDQWPLSNSHCIQLNDHWQTMRDSINQTIDLIVFLLQNLQQHQGGAELNRNIVQRLLIEVRTEFNRIVQTRQRTAQQLVLFNGWANQNPPQHLIRQQQQQSLVQHQWLPHFRPENHQDTLNRLLAAVNQCRMIVQQDHNAQQVRQFAQGLLMIMPGAPGFDSLFQEYSQRASPVSQRLVQLRQRLEQIRPTIEAIVLGQNPFLMNQLNQQNQQIPQDRLNRSPQLRLRQRVANQQGALQEMHDEVLPVLNEARDDIAKIADFHRRHHQGQG